MREHNFLSETAQKLSLRRHSDSCVVLATGVFDILHQEHIKFLKNAKAVADILIVGIETDTRVKQMKGANRPINNQHSRLQAIQATGLVDISFLLPESFSTPAEHEYLIKQLRPDILAVSSHTNHIRQKQKILEKYGGRVEVVHQHNPDISTTHLINKGSYDRKTKEN